MIKVNGEEVSVSDITINEYLSGTSYDIKRIAVEVNGEIVPKSKYESTLLSNGDTVEVVSFVGGG